ncbi:hypothetical protein [Streptomyces sp. NBC_00356]|uniref:hypothetical protein n=1 Tax=Streptomyces sp. NBC_00356 TaxID=2975724 RepID=UPI002E2714CA
MTPVTPVTPASPMTAVTPANPAVTVRFEPTRSASRARRMVTFGLGALLWIGVGLLAVTLLGPTGIMVRLLFVTAITCAYFSLTLASRWGLWRLTTMES